MSMVTVAATQMACSWDREANVARGERLIRQAAERGAQIILLQELFETPYFCQDHDPRHLDIAWQRLIRVTADAESRREEHLDLVRERRSFGSERQ